LLWAIANVTNKYALGYISFWNSSGLIFMFSALIFMAMFLRKQALRDIASLKNKRQTIGLALGNQVLVMVGATLSFWATQLGSVSLAAAILNSRPLFVFIFAAIIGRFAPNFIIHELHRYALLEANTQTCKYNYMPENGMYEVPDLPGLGQELTDEAIRASIVETVR
jgi:hypothetical protein